MQVRDIRLRSYWEALAFLGNRRSRKLCNNTWVDSNLSGECIGIRFYETTIVQYARKGDIILNSGGYLTATTRERINKLLPDYWVLYQEKWKWTLHTSDRSLVFPFADGMVLSPILTGLDGWTVTYPRTVQA